MPWNPLSKLRALFASRVVSTPTVLQMDRVECGAASLAMILAHHGRYVPLEELRSSCDVNRDGAKPGNIIRAAKLYGLKAKGFKRTVESVTQLPLPAIIHWQFNHFVVLEGRKGDLFYINDPMTGRRRVGRDDFADSFTGVALAFEKGPEFTPGGHRPSVLLALLSYLRNSKAAFLFVFLASAGLVLPGLALPLFTTVFIDEYLVKGRSELVRPLLLTMALVLALNTGFSWLRTFYLLRLRTKLAISRTSGFLWHILHLPVDFFQQRLTGELVHRIAINDSIAGVVSGSFATNLLNFFSATFFLALMVVFDPLLAALAVVAATLNLVSLRVTERVRLESERLLLNTAGGLYGATQSGLAMIDTLKATGSESDFYSVWVGHFARKLNAQREQALYADIVALVPGVLQGLGDAAILYAGATRILDGRMTIGMLVAFQLLRMQFAAPFNQLVSLRAQLQRTESELGRLDDVLRHQRAPNLVVHPPADVDTARVRLRGEIEFRDVQFGYSRFGEPLLTGFDLRIAAGSRVALVGPSGSGKSTIARLACGLYTPAAGEILFDGQPRQRIHRPALANSLALVDQEIHLFNDTIRNNISLWDSSIPIEQLVDAARDACIHDAIAERERGYEAVLTEHGANMSGGQRQRLEIARALAGNPSILVLDEATSALDPVTEKLVMDNLRRRGCTCVLVAHRLSTIRDCDAIVVLDAGAIVEMGAHSDLLQRGRAYAQLIEAA